MGLNVLFRKNLINHSTEHLPSELLFILGFFILVVLLSFLASSCFLLSAACLLLFNFGRCLGCFGFLASLHPGQDHLLSERFEAVDAGLDIVAFAAEAAARYKHQWTTYLLQQGFKVLEFRGQQHLVFKLIQVDELRNPFQFFLDLDNVLLAKDIISQPSEVSILQKQLRCNLLIREMAARQVELLELIDGQDTCCLKFSYQILLGLEEVLARQEEFALVYLAELVIFYDGEELVTL